MDNSSIIDELFARIQSLEDENKNLKTKIGELETDLVKKEGENDENIDQDQEEKKQDNMMIDDTVEELKPIKSITISYIPNETLSKLYIMGDFTNWELIEMTKETSNIFTFNILLLNGFKYFYCFYTDDQPIVDFNNLYEENLSNGQIQNVLYLANEDNKFEEYDFSKNKKQWESAKKHYFRKRIGEETDVRLIEDSIARADTEKIKTERIVQKKNEKINRIKKLYDLKIEELKKNHQIDYNSLNSNFKGRIIKRNEIPYLVNRVEEMCFKCIRLYDKNGMRIHIDHYLQIDYQEKIELKSLFSNTIVCSAEESKYIMDQYYKNTTVLKIYYQYFSNSPQKRSSGYMNYVSQYSQNLEQESNNVNLDNVQLDLVPYKVEPEYIDLNQYNIEISENKIKSVVEKESLLKVIFDSQLISEEIESKFSSFVSQSTMRVYTTLYSQNIVNIVHIHLNDTSESIAVDTFFLEKKDSVSDFKKFDVDMTGKKLNYKFLFRDFKLIKIFYNLSKDFIDEPKFEEVRISTGRIVKINNYQGNSFYGKITKVPIGMLSRKEKDMTEIEDRSVNMEGKEALCAERHLEELPGYIEIEILFDDKKNLLDKPKNVSIPVCFINPISNKDEVIFEKILLKNENYQKINSQNELNSMFDEFEKLQRFLLDPKSLNELMLEEAKITLNKLQHNTPALLENIAKVVDDNEENINKMNIIHKVTSQLIPIITQHIRALSFSIKK